MTGDNLTPYISVVVAARNDDEGGNLLPRMQAFLDNWLAQAKRYGLRSEVIIVEWNPPPDRPRLIDALEWRRDRGPCEVRFIEVSSEVHQRFKNAAAIPLHHLIAKNAGIRRARGEYVLATNPDVIFSPELVEFLAARRLEPRTLYRIDRLDAAGNFPSAATPDDIVRHSEDHVLGVLTEEGKFELTKDGKRVLEAEDIVDRDAGIRFGPGCYPVERSGTAPFRWLNGDAEIHFRRAAGTPPRLWMDVETGPSAGSEPLGIQILDPGGAVLASASFKGRSRLCLHFPPQLSSAKLRFRFQSADLPLERDPRILNLRVFSLRWDDDDKAARRTSAASSTIGASVAAVEPRQIQIRLKPGSGARLASWEAIIKNRLGATLFQMGADPLEIARADEYVLTLDFGFELAGSQDVSNAREQDARDPMWALEVAESCGGVDWGSALEAPSSCADQMRNAAHLHTNGCAEFTLVARKDWMDLRGYAEFPLWPEPTDALFCYAAHHAGVRQEILGEPLRIYHLDHASTEEADSMNRLSRDDFVKWIDQMRRLNAPVIFTHENWGLGDVELPERTV